MDDEVQQTRLEIIRKVALVSRQLAIFEHRSAENRRLTAARVDFANSLLGRIDIQRIQIMLLASCTLAKKYIALRS